MSHEELQKHFDLGLNGLSATDRQDLLDSIAPLHALAKSAFEAANAEVATRRYDVSDPSIMESPRDRLSEPVNARAVFLVSHHEERMLPNTRVNGNLVFHFERLESLRIERRFRENAFRVCHIQHSLPVHDFCKPLRPGFRLIKARNYITGFLNFWFCYNFPAVSLYEPGTDRSEEIRQEIPGLLSAEQVAECLGRFMHTQSQRPLSLRENVHTNRPFSAEPVIG